MKISVVIPTYNEETRIRKCLESILNQDVEADEIIVVDNNNKDKTSQIARKMGVRVVRERKQGMIPARNCGFDSVRGDIIARIDADVTVPHDWIKRIKKNFESGKIDALTGPVILADHKIKAITKSTLPSHIYLESLRMLTGGKRYLQGPNMSLTSRIWQKVRDNVTLDDSKVHEDLDLSLKIIKSGGIIGYDRRLTVNGSARRIMNKPESFFVEYPTRVVKTFWINRD